ncbi:hypothetical protein [Campylobacter suis]|uniref:Uncharacterized protein n=1 Tax=Campylobacter suis TaxID=2790657 RepID=A0ABN7K7M5_9BACT|nr:hypothetical protein [Campylobacter suis]CAD7288493.1 hypothetical protein LMG8286_01337 [Campylobacter suis]
MQLIGHPLVPYEPLKFVKYEKDICKNCVINFDENLIGVAQKKKVEFGLICTSISEAIIANAVGAKIIICEKNIAKNIAKLAQFYLFDSKIACFIKTDSELENLAELEVDTAIYKQALT